MRYADILMNYAECLVETGTNPADAAVYVDKVRERAGLAKLKDSQWKDCLSSKDAFISVCRWNVLWNSVSKVGVGLT